MFRFSYYFFPYFFWCSVYFYAEGAGDLYIRAECMNVSEIYAIEDCTYYSTTRHTRTPVTFNVPLPNGAFEVQYNSFQASSSASVPYIDIGDSTNNRMLIGQYARAGGNGLIVYKSSSTTHAYSQNIVTNQENTIVFKYTGTGYEYSLNNGTAMTVADAGVTLTKLIHVESVNSDVNYIENIKIKPL